jgi:acyl transferase domain-containing protein
MNWVSWVQGKSPSREFAFPHTGITIHHVFAVSPISSFRQVISNRPVTFSNKHGSMTIRTGCSASLIGLNEACMALGRGDCKSAIVAGTNVIMAPNLSITMSETGVISKDASCKTFSADADGYGRGEAVVAFYVKPLDDAIRDGNPIRAVLAGSATNHDGRTNGLTLPSAEAQEALIRRAYEIGGITDPSK